MNDYWGYLNATYTWMNNPDISYLLRKNSRRLFYGTFKTGIRP